MALIAICNNGIAICNIVQENTNRSFPQAVMACFGHSPGDLAFRHDTSELSAGVAGMPSSAGRQVALVAGPRTRTLGMYFANRVDFHAKCRDKGDFRALLSRFRDLRGCSRFDECLQSLANDSTKVGCHFSVCRLLCFHHVRIC